MATNAVRLAPEICRLSALDIAALVRAREISPVEVVEACVDRIEEIDPLLNAFAYVRPDDAVDAARRAERAVATGGPLGALHGVPVAIKDLYDFKSGWPNTFGCAVLRDHVSPTTSLAVARLEAAGAIVVGKTNTSEFGHRGTTDSALHGPTSTPWAPGRNAGGSSGGAAAAVAARMVPVAMGSDAAGSIRIPAALCGVLGFKPTHGLVAATSRPNAFRASLPLAQGGPIAATTADATALLAAIAGPHPRDPLSAPSAPPTGLDALPAAEGMRVAWSPDLGTFPVEPAVAATAERAAHALEEAGARVTRVEIDLGHSHTELERVILRLFGVALHGALADRGIDPGGPERESLAPELVALVDGVRDVLATDALAVDRIRTAVHDGIEDVLAEHDVIVTPTVAVTPFPNRDGGRTLGPSEIEGRTVDPLLGWCLTFPVNLTGHPAASAPAGLAAPGAPVGLQVIGPRFRDDTVLAACAALERVRPWRLPGDGPV